MSNDSHIIPNTTVTGATKLSAWVVCLILSFFGLLTPNPLLNAFAMLIPAFVITILWRPGEPPILPFAAGFQWLQAASPVLAANFEGNPISNQPLGSFLDQAAWLSLLAIPILASGMALGIRRMPKIELDVPRAISAQLSSQKLFIAYIVALFLSMAFVWISMRAGGLRQPILALASIKWIPLFLLCWSTLQCQKPKGFMLVAIAIEIILGFSGYFSSFKNVLFLLLVVVVGTASDRPRLPKAQIAIVLAITLLLVGYWQAIKSDYRNYLNQGTNRQVVLVSFQERMRYLAEAVTKVTPADMSEGYLSGIKRLGYIDYFAYSIRNVPANVPHQDGKLWIDSIKHVFMPRILFPEKASTNDSARTNYFTGLQVAGEERGTSISIGYLGESYIDFGVRFMWIPILVVGYFYGWIYAYFTTRDEYHIIGYAVATAILLFSALLIETSNVKLVGGVVTSFLAFAILFHFVRYKFLDKVSAE